MLKGSVVVLCSRLGRCPCLVLPCRACSLLLPSFARGCCGKPPCCINTIYVSVLICVLQQGEC